ncbi:MAG: hypothetical protein K9G09_00860 [Pontimonas sp.]|nr:hypothetical protein [Pontimonas sp.]
MNPDGEVVLLTDVDNEDIPEALSGRITTSPLDDYLKRASDFAAIYSHRGSNSVAYELLNFQRWFIVLEHLERHPTAGSIMYCDSDAFLYLPVSQVAAVMTTAMSVCSEVGPQFTVFTSARALRDYCDFITRTYSSPEALEAIQEFVDSHRSAGLPHISDMATLGVYAERNNLDDLGQPGRHDFVFDENIGSEQGLQLGLLGKRIRTRSGKKWFIRPTGEEVIAGGVHLQGGNKTLWPLFVDIPVLLLLSRKEPRLLSQALFHALKKAFTVVFLRIGQRGRIALRRFQTPERLRANT